MKNNKNIDCRIFKIKTIDIKTGEEKTYNSQQCLAKELGVKKSSISYYVSKGIYRDYKIVKTNERVHRNNFGFKKSIELTDKTTKKKLMFKSLRTCHEYLIKQGYILSLSHFSQILLGNKKSKILENFKFRCFTQKTNCSTLPL